MTLPTVSPTDAKRLIDEGAQLINIRGQDEHAREHFAAARNQPIDTLTTINGRAKQIIFHCKAGSRTAGNAAKLAEASLCEAFILEGGIEAWKKAGLPVVTDRNQPIEIGRQVQIAAGSFVLLGLGLGFLVAPAFLAISAFIGAGLIFAGVSGWCGMAKLFAAMPWNKSVALGS